MLTIFRRHTRKCPHRKEGQDYKKCTCTLHVQGMHRGEYLRESLKTQNWEIAQSIVRDMEADSLLPEPEPQVTIKTAVDKFLKDLVAQNLADVTLAKHKRLLERRLLTFCSAKDIQYFDKLTVDIVGQFRQTWSTGPHPEGLRKLEALEAKKTLERLRSFFRFCQSRDFTSKNPASELKAPKVPDIPTLPFEKDEMEKILWACELFSTHGRYRAKNRTRVKAMVLLMRYSGIAIRDAVTLERKSIDGDTLFLRRAKTGVPVKVVLPEKVLAALSEVNDFTERYFWNGVGKVTSAVGIWERTFKRLFQIAGIEDGHPHRFRDTFSVELLNKGVPLDLVSKLLGHSSIKTTEKHYAPWVKSRQDELEKALRLAQD
jgi:integrase